VVARDQLLSDVERDFEDRAQVASPPEVWFDPAKGLIGTPGRQQTPAPVKG
jgi:hypothetical protein